MSLPYNHRTHGIPDLLAGASAADEWVHWRQLVNTVKGGTRLSELLSPQLSKWVNRCLVNGISLDLMASLQPDVQRLHMPQLGIGPFLGDVEWETWMKRNNPGWLPAAESQHRWSAPPLDMPQGLGLRPRMGDDEYELWMKQHNPGWMPMWERRQQDRDIAEATDPRLKVVRLEQRHAGHLADLKSADRTITSLTDENNALAEQLQVKEIELELMRMEVQTATERALAAEQNEKAVSNSRDSLQQAYLQQNAELDRYKHINQPVPPPDGLGGPGSYRGVTVLNGVPLTPKAGGSAGGSMSMNRGDNVIDLRQKQADAEWQKRLDGFISDLVTELRDEVPAKVSELNLILAAVRNRRISLEEHRAMHSRLRETEQALRKQSQHMQWQLDQLRKGPDSVWLMQADIFINKLTKLVMPANTERADFDDMLAVVQRVHTDLAMERELRQNQQRELDAVRGQMRAFVDKLSLILGIDVSLVPPPDDLNAVVGAVQRLRTDSTTRSVVLERLNNEVEVQRNQLLNLTDQYSRAQFRWAAAMRDNDDMHRQNIQLGNRLKRIDDAAGTVLDG